ncbi:uncharacterized protein MYCFIDRAFT_207257 [Pseudocercospora fijiensis CIRAD86]|uniref:Uncharacterized protein n=1 Tax=Pseudocercospora fijiensis (strain CIRAD86) TaxID=383855 RepID=M2Z3H2_PSEFD|nr:uncharacterized protein MYCFIDRAFT_207257 [Pseudocercospora fijiensis CIRAD86]EME84380.1 hypothetical protein MYCFIDRAFT_207257 [Pseudocercospora fijiensis CIRAD86]
MECAHWGARVVSNRGRGGTVAQDVGRGDEDEVRLWYGPAVNVSPQIMVSTIFCWMATEALALAPRPRFLPSAHPDTDTDVAGCHHSSNFVSVTDFPSCLTRSSMGASEVNAVRRDTNQRPRNSMHRARRAGPRVSFNAVCSCISSPRPQSPRLDLSVEPRILTAWASASALSTPSLQSLTWLSSTMLDCHEPLLTLASERESIDESKWDEYFGALAGCPKDESIHLRLFEWFSDSAHRPAEVAVDSAAELITRDRSPHCDLRVIVARLSATQLVELNAMQAIFRHYDFPTSFLSDRIQAVSHAFGARRSTMTPAVEIAWSHFLCKDVKSHWHQNQPRRSPYTDKAATDGPRWRRCDAFLHVRNRSDGSECVTLLCFGASQPLVERFNRLLGNASWTDVVKEPFLLFSIVYEDLYTQLDTIAWTLADVFRPVERSTLDRTGVKESSAMAQSVDFASLHNISKHCIYISEATEAAILSVDSMIAHLRSHRLVISASMTDAALSHLTCRKLALQSTQLRIRSLEKRMANIISLSFNLVTQQDSRVMQNDSNAMKAIAVLTLIFLPLTGIASLFSTPFFSVDFDTSQKSLQVATCFWIFWVITVPLTLVMLGGWIVWYHSVKEKRTGNLDKKVKAIDELGRADSRSWIDRLQIGNLAA